LLRHDENWIPIAEKKLNCCKIWFKNFILKSLKVHIFEAMIAEKIILGIDPGTTVMGLGLFP
jgi:hypothetical protein